MEETSWSKTKRKKEGKRLKRQRIDESGGVRPRKEQAVVMKQPVVNLKTKGGRPIIKSSISSTGKSRNRNTNAAAAAAASGQQHRFGRVMDAVPCRGQPRHSTVSLAIPGSIVANCQTRELKTQISGQIARAATIYHIDEIIVFDDKLAKKEHTTTNYHGRSRDNSNRRTPPPPREPESRDKKQDDDRPRFSSASADPHAFMARILQYCECPQYLRRHFFPMHPDLQFAGLLAPIDAPHHVRAEDRNPFREGVVLEPKHATSTQGTGSLVNCGIRGRPVHIEQRIQPGVRCTIQIDPAAYGRPGPIHGTVVSPSTVTQTDGTYWGYTVRMASSIKNVFDECPFKEQKYDLTIGTSERGTESLDDDSFTLLNTSKSSSSSGGPSSSYRHALIVIGGVAGIEECVDADESLQLSGAKSSTMFDKWINICSFQGSRTIRSEEAVLICLAKLSPLLAKAGAATGSRCGTNNEDELTSAKNIGGQAVVKFSDNELSEESSDSEGSSSDRGE